MKRFHNYQTFQLCILDCIWPILRISYKIDIERLCNCRAHNWMPFLVTYPGRVSAYGLDTAFKWHHRCPRHDSYRPCMMVLIYGDAENKTNEHEIVIDQYVAKKLTRAHIMKKLGLTLWKYTLQKSIRKEMAVYIYTISVKTYKAMIYYVSN